MSNKNKNNDLKINEKNKLLDSLVDENNNSNKNDLINKKITFLLKDNKKFFVDLQIAILGYPNLINNFDFNLLSIKLPEWIDEKNIKDYFYYVIEYNSEKFELDLNSNYRKFMNFNFKKLIKIANYFQNENILENIINFYLIPNLNIETCVKFINDAYLYKNNNNNNENLNDNILIIWNIFYNKLINFFVDNFIEIIKDNNKIKKLNKNILENVLEIYLNKNYFIEEKPKIKKNIIKKIIKFIAYIRDLNIDKNESNINSDDFYKLIQIENKRLNSFDITNNNREDTIFFNLNLINFLANNEEKENEIFQEIILEILNKKIILLIKLNKIENNLKIYIKPKNFNNKLFYSFSSFVELENDNKINCYNLSCINNEQYLNIIKLNNFSLYLNDFYNNNIKENNFSFKVYLKINIIESFLISYLINNFDNYYKSKNIYKLSSKNLKNIFLTNVNNLNEEQKLICLINWCKILINNYIIIILL